MTEKERLEELTKLQAEVENLPKGYISEADRPEEGTSGAGKGYYSRPGGGPLIVTIRGDIESLLRKIAPHS